MGRYDRFSKNLRRLQGYDYRWEGLYFITICTKNRVHFFGKVVEGELQLTDGGVVARDFWAEIPNLQSQVFLGPYVIMPNHMHGIIGLKPLEDPKVPSVASLQCGDVLAPNPGPMSQHMAKISPKKGSISRIINSYKAACTRQIRQHIPDFAWQARFHDHIIRNEQELKRIEDYILSNPEKWVKDCFFN
jgi:putative transposase